MKTTSSINIPIDMRSSSGAFSGVTRCTNLISSTIDGRRTLCVAPGLKIIANGRRTPLAAFHDAEGLTHTLFRLGNDSLAILTGDDWLTLPDKVNSPSVAVATRTGFVVMTADGPVNLLYDGEQWSASSTRTPAPEITVEAVGAGSISVVTSPLTLKNVDFDRSNANIDESSVRSLRDLLADAYVRLTQTADAGSLWMQPVVVRLQLIANSGAIVHTSAPMVMAPDGWQCTSVISAECSKSGTSLDVPALHISATAYRLKVTIPPEVAQSLSASSIAQVRILASPQLHPFDASVDPSWRIVRPALSNPGLDLTIPGATQHFGSLDTQRASQLSSLITGFNSVASTIFSLDAPFPEGSMMVSRSSPLSLDTELALTSKSYSATTVFEPSDYASSLLREISPPASFTAATATVSGDMVAWADITPIPSTIFALSDICAGFVDEPTRGVVVIHRRDGTSSTLAVEAPRRPTAWASSVSVPDPYVTALDLYIESSDGGTFHGSVSLSPSPDASRAAWLNPTLQPVPFSIYNDNIPSPDRTRLLGTRRPGAIVAARLSEPSLPISALECCHSPIRSLMPALRSQSSWDFSRCHLYALSDDAIHAVSINASRKLVSATMIDPRGIPCSEAAVTTPHGVMAIHPTDRVGGQLLSIAASRASTIDVCHAGSRLGWHLDSESLWTADDNGRLQLRLPTLSKLSDIDVPVDVVSIRSVGNRLWISDSSALFRVESPDETAADASLRAIRWEAAAPLPPHVRIAAIEIVMQASRFEGNITLSAGSSQICCSMRPLLNLNICGTVRTPVIRRIIAPPMPFASINISAQVSTDFRLHSITLKTI